MNRLFLFLPLIFVLFSCKKQVADLEEFSPDKKAKVTIHAEKEGLAAAWKVEMKVKAYDFKEGSLTFEIANDELSAKTVSYEWKDAQNAIIKINQSDNEPRVFQLIASPNQVQLAEISQ